MSHDATLRRLLSSVIVVMAQAGPVRPEALAPGGRASRAALEPAPYSFDIDEISVSARGRVLVRDGFDQTGSFRPAEVAGQSGEVPRYDLHMGFVDGSYVRDGMLRLDESCSINPFENYAFDFSLPVDGRGRYSFEGRELFGDLEIRVRLLRPRIAGSEKLKIGLVDDQLYLTAAMVSLEHGRATLQRQGGDPRTMTPYLETTFDQVDLERWSEPDEVELRLLVDAGGRSSAIVRVRAGAKQDFFRMRAQEPWALLDPRARYSVHIFVEDLARPRIFSVYPESVSAALMRENGGVLQMKVFGIGFGSDSRLELVREDGGGQAQSSPQQTRVLMFNMGVETTIRLPSPEPGAYTVRIRTGQAEAFRARGLRVMD